MLLGWAQSDLSEKSGVSLRTLGRFEQGDASEASAKARDALYHAFVNADIEFIASNTDSAELDGVGLRWKPRHPHSGIKIV